MGVLVPMAPVARENTLKLRLGVPPVGPETTLPQSYRGPSGAGRAEKFDIGAYSRYSRGIDFT